MAHDRRGLLSVERWTLINAAAAVFYLWVLRGGGARWLEGWKGTLFFGRIRGDSWNVEQLRFFALFLLVFQGVWYVLGLFYPELRW